MRSDSHATLDHAAPPAPAPGRSAATALTRRQWRQIALITFVALGVFALLRWLPTGTNLSHMDFRVEAKNPIDFCDPLNPQFIPVVAVPSPVSMTLAATTVPMAGRELSASVRLATASGKPIAPADLLVVHTERLHLLIVDPTLTDYQHVHPSPGAVDGTWDFRFTPQRAGAYRVFADFTPAATSRGLYASADLAVAAGEEQAGGTEQGAGRKEQESAANALLVEQAGYRFRLTSGAEPLQARKPIDLRFAIERAEGDRVPLEPVMGAYAHLVAFDVDRSGFAHLHPTQLDLAAPPDARHPVLDFKITIPQPGRYVIWAQVNLGGREVFVPFWIEVV